MAYPLISVAIPTLNRPDLLIRTLESVTAQSWQNLEIIVSDNASSPETAKAIESVKDPRMSRYRQDIRLSMELHWNACLSKATGEYFILLSDDDLLMPDALEALAGPLVDSQVSMSYSPFIAINEEGVPLMQSAPGPSVVQGADFIGAHLNGQLAVMPSGVMGRTQAIRELGGFPEIGTTADLGLRLLLATEGKVACVPRAVVKYRVHGSSLSRQAAAVVASHLELHKWSRSRKELAAHWPQIDGYVQQVVVGYGYRSALTGDSDAVAACHSALANMKASRLRRSAFTFVAWGAKRKVIRFAMRIRHAFAK